MKILKILILFMITTSLMAQEFTITPLEEGLDLSSLNSGIKIKKIEDFKDGKYLSPKVRDEIFNKILGSRTSILENEDRDLIYKSFVHYSKERLQSKYPKFKSTEIDKLMTAFKKEL